MVTFGFRRSESKTMTRSEQEAKIGTLRSRFAYLETAMSDRNSSGSSLVQSLSMPRSSIQRNS
eukprot:6211446-Pleurochrysis_carterae.AAC.3